MKVLLETLGNKYFLWIIITIGLLSAFQLRSCQIKKGEESLETYKRQVRGQLSEKERVLQSANKELGVLRADLVTQKELAEELKKSNLEKDRTFDVFKKKHSLQIKSKDKAIARLKQKIGGGNTTVVITPYRDNCKDVDKCVVSYEWEESLKRFKLTDPDIFTKDNELFETNQLFRVYGEVWEQKDGSLQIRRLVIREVYLDENGDLQLIEDGKADIVDSEFKYSNEPTIIGDTDWADLFKLRAVALGSITAIPDGGATKLGLGLEFFNWRGMGINTHTALDFQDMGKTEQRIGFGFTPNIFDVDLNVAVGLSVGTPLTKFFKEYSINADLIFYLNN